MPNIHSYYGKISSLTHVVNDLLYLAQHERWNDLLLEWPRYELATSNLPNICWSDLSDIEKILLEEKLQQLDVSHSNLLQLTFDWREHLQEMLQGAVQSRKLSDHYR